MSTLGFEDQYIKKPNVSGQFYSANPSALTKEIGRFISSAQTEPSRKHIEMIIAPHAGYMYSGAVAGHSFKSASSGEYKTIVIIAPSHFYGFDGVSIWPRGEFETPLGKLEVDEAFSSQLTGLNKKFRFDPRAFEREHSLEVELPFLQKTFSGYKIVPVIMGQASFETCQNLARALREVIGKRRDVLIVISTDMSHYHDGETAKKMDFQAIDAIRQLKAEELFKLSHMGVIELCGFIPVTTALIYAKEKGINHADLLKYANSGDVSGDQSSVVGYTSFIFYTNPGNHEPEELPIQQKNSLKNIAPLNEQQKKRLIEIARETIQTYIREGKIPEVQENDPRLRINEGAFVTIHKNANLRGCIGRVIGSGPLYLTVRDMAIEAAVHDPRFDPVSENELRDLEVEVSVLSQPRQIRDISEIQMGVHGVIVMQGNHHGLFLPQVAEQTGWNKEEFLSELCSQKAGLSRDAWRDPKTRIEIFTADVFTEQDVK